MLKIENLTKNFDYICAVNHITLEIPERIIYGLLGTNGAGKSTLLRMMAGIVKADEGNIWVDDEICYDNPRCKEKFFYLSDEPYYFPNANIDEMAHFYKMQYPRMDIDGVTYMAELLELDMKRPIRTFSKGMKRQAFLILALCTNTKYLLCDEVFDGLDPVVTEVMKELFRQEMKEREFTAIIASHKLQDLEDICQHIGILHKGGILQAGEMRGKAKHVHKIQCVFPESENQENVEEWLCCMRKQLDIVRYQKEGYFTTLVVRGEVEQIYNTLGQRPLIFCKEVLMSLEEVFIAEMEEAGYDIRKVLY